jgi:thioester reductase-like protein
MNHLESYAMAKPANVDGAKELLRFATSQTPKPINYMSSLGIFSGCGNGTTRLVDELSSIDHEKHLTSNGYTASKWVSEKIFTMASERGIPCNIFRLGLIWADTKAGRYDELQWGYRVIKTSLLSGYGIRNYRYAMAPTPVDYVARAVVFLANRHSAGRGIFHISSPNQTTEGLFERCNAVAGTALKLVSFYEWVREIKRLHEEGRTLPEVPLIEFAFSLDEESLNKYQRAMDSTNVRFDCRRTYQDLACAGVVAPVLTDDMLAACLSSMFHRDPDLSVLLNQPPGAS